MAHLVEHVRMSEGGRIVIPARMRAELGLEPGDDVVLELEDGSLRLASRARGVERAQQILGKYAAGGPSLSEELIAERRTG